MKNKIKYILAGCCLMTTFSCSDFLERYPLDKAVNDTYWKTEAQLRAALYPCYEGLQYDLIINLGEACAETERRNQQCARQLSILQLLERHLWPHF